MSRIVCCVLLGVMLQISHGCNLKKPHLCGAKYVIVSVANLEQQLEKRATFIPTSCNNSSEMKMCQVRVSCVWLDLVWLD